MELPDNLWPHFIHPSPPAVIAAWDPAWNSPDDALNTFLETAFQSNPSSTRVPTSRSAAVIEEQNGCRVGPIEFRVTGPDDKPCPNAAVGFDLFWLSTPESHKPALNPRTWRTDDSGVFRKESYRECMYPTVVYAIDEKRKLAGYTIVERLSELDRPVLVKMLPARTVVGKIKFATFGGLRPEYIRISFNPGEKPFDRCLVQSATLDSFEMLMPPGKWTMSVTGSSSVYEFPAPPRTFTIESSPTDLKLDDFEVVLAASQKLIGQAAPSWQVASWHGGGRHTLEEFKGKCVLLNFWQAGSDPVLRVKEILELSEHCRRKVTSILISYPFAKGFSEIEASLGVADSATFAALQTQLQKGKLRLGFDAPGTLGDRHRGKTAEIYGASPFKSYLINPGR